MKNYKVTITETLQKEVVIKANSLAEAEELAEEKWNNSEFILDANHFVGAAFHAEQPQKQRGFDR